MHESFSTSGSRPSDHCGFKTDAQSLPSLFHSSDLWKLYMRCYRVTEDMTKG
ncbi:hypothetical protein NC653_008119 [Populus alba x Populus x berolinensis]|uniref:Uncharacterized protein n=1 Tax=Populus alba x Populus x berolinensis TaxID=444605 RepID=A0AAD6R5X8_9ROSI|nr:hypothetical protein NC653_008119 [Populus alba x Populus x berolinensis]